MSRNAIICASLAALTLVVFARIVTHGYVIWDDQINIYENPHFTGESEKGISAFFTAPFEGLYIPVTYTAWSLIALVAGEKIDPEVSPDPVLNPAWFHAANLLLHLSCVFLVYGIIRRLLGNSQSLAAGLGAALFAIHPLQVEPVAWATGMKDVLSAFFGLCVVAIYLWNSRRQRDRKRGSLFLGPGYAPALLLFLVALLSKPGMVMLPFALFLLDTLVAKTPWKKTAAALLPFVILAVATAAWTAIVQASPDAVTGEVPVTSNLPFHLRPVVALNALTLYLSKLIYPLSLATQYDFSPEYAAGVATRFPIWTVPFLAAAFLLRGSRTRPFYLAGFGLAFLFLIPVLGFIPFGFQRVSIIADRYMYFPMFGVALALAARLATAQSATPKVLAGAALAIFTVLSASQVKVWKSPATLFTHTYRVNPNSVAAASNLGAAAMNTRNYEEALVHYKRLLTINRDSSEAHAIVGNILNQIGQPAEAIPYLEKAIALDARSAKPYTDLGISRFRLGEFDTAVLLFRKSLELKPDSADTLVNLGAAYSNTGHPAEAISAFEEAARIDPKPWQPHQGLATIFMKERRYPEAVAALEQVVARRPDDPEVFSLLATAHAANGRLPEAARAAERAVQTAQNIPGHPADALLRYRNQLQDLRSRLAP